MRKKLRGKLSGVEQSTLPEEILIGAVIERAVLDATSRFEWGYLAGEKKTGVARRDALRFIFSEELELMLEIISNNAKSLTRKIRNYVDATVDKA